MPQAAEQRPVEIQYEFRVADGGVRRVVARLDRKTSALISTPLEAYPDWTRLSFEKCPNCPLNESEHPRCPVAAGLAELAPGFRDYDSLHAAEVAISTENRRYIKNTTLADGLTSLIGIYMVTTGCPILGRLRPMVQSHLPFATWEETFYRAVSMYLVAQYFAFRRGEKPDWDLVRLLEIYREIGVVNKSIIRRFSKERIQDAILNAVAGLDALAGLAAIMLKTRNMDPIQRFFNAYFD